MTTKPTPNYMHHALIAFALAVVMTLFLEHSRFDVAISELFYQGQGQWLIDKADKWFDGIFYTTPKRLLIVLALYIIAAWVYRRRLNAPNPHAPSRLAVLFCPVGCLSVRELGYLAITMPLVPTVVATLKGLTHTPCPVSLVVFGGDLPYLSLFDNMHMEFGEKCFPAAHASSGFALYTWCFVPSLWRYRKRIAIMVTLFAWLMGGYKMAIGDHFFSHTLVSMLLAWAMAAGMGWVFFAKRSN